MPAHTPLISLIHLGTEEQLIHILRERNWIHSAGPKCKCQERMTVCKQDQLGKWKWFCSNSQCNNRVSVYYDSLFQLMPHSNPIAVYNAIMSFTSPECTARSVAVNYGLGEKSVQQLFNALRKILSTYLQTLTFTQVPDTLEMIDETCSGKRKDDVGRHLKGETVWYFTMYEPDQHLFKAFEVPDRTKDTLVAIINKELCQEGQKVWSDGWASYDSLEVDNYTHETVIHKRYWVDPNTGCTINALENCHSVAKRFQRVHFGISLKYKQLYFDSYSIYRYFMDIEDTKARRMEIATVLFIYYGFEL